MRTRHNSQAAQAAKRKLLHYLRYPGTDATDADTQVEVEEIVDHIIDAAIEETIATIRAGGAIRRGET